MWQKVKEKKKYTLRKEMTSLMLRTSACTLLSAVLAILYVFFSFFFQKTKEDIEYVLKSTSQQYQSHMQFIADGAISIRHNILLDDFFENNGFDREVVEEQLSYSMELFADRNRVNQQLPFVTSLYLFNNNDQCINEHYYATTLAFEMEEENKYRSIQRWFKADGNRYASLTDKENLNILFRIYDDKMEEKGIGIAQISLKAIDAVFENVSNYKDGSWMLLSGNDFLLFPEEKAEIIDKLSKTEAVWSGMRNVGGEKVIGYADVCGFDIRLITTVDQSNIFSILRPILVIFLIGLGIVLALTFIVAYGVSYRFTKPVTKMISSIQAFGKQELNARIEDSSIQEFHDIGTVFNEMADRIEYLITEVYEKQLIATQSKVKYLQSQINPHFQFNILAMLSLKAKMAGNEDLYQSLNAFSKLMQGKIFREKEIKIKVKEELDIVKFYLILQKERYQEKLSYDIYVEDDRIYEDMIPRLLIEPLVENAVSHGLEPQKERGSIVVRLYEEFIEKENRSSMLHICVEDNGVGMGEKEIGVNTQDEPYKVEHTHTGFENTKRMLQILYGDNYEFKIWSEKGKGTKIEIIIPVERGINYVESNSGR
ncbi:sensor histidine kinase [Lachnoanaerobaculum gingivalis]|uniref:sensor histidine kinase n=1 Tax=Lachnoanaerobaculum gingivalis TaxID=2490855 RepID=UPI0024A72BF2|nr:histidine kinase [Lachnoanaerobaculum gingivalis]WHE87665.1 histidine kinase [Lachnoanaerobaculum gingivalis]